MVKVEVGNRAKTQALAAPGGLWTHFSAQAAVTRVVLPA